MFYTIYFLKLHFVYCYLWHNCLKNTRFHASHARLIQFLEIFSVTKLLTGQCMVSTILISTKTLSYCFALGPESATFWQLRWTIVASLWPGMQKNSIPATATKQVPLRSHVCLPRFRLGHQNQPICDILYFRGLMPSYTVIYYYYIFYWV